MNRGLCDGRSWMIFINGRVIISIISIAQCCLCCAMSSLFGSEELFCWTVRFGAEAGEKMVFCRHVRGSMVSICWSPSDGRALGINAQKLFYLKNLIL
ncbi:hypothetical protein, partial [Bartonella sp. AP58NXGY]|uniref:hypothetical protein n=1 Tax=Bartonella sp. AP58NXGY TaxID=3243498 RepID=UPI0035D017E7